MTKIVSMAAMAAAMAAASAAYPAQVQIVNEHWADIVEPFTNTSISGLGKATVEVATESVMVQLLSGIDQLNFLRRSTPGEDGLWLALADGADVIDPASDAAAKAAKSAADAAAADQAAADAAAAAAAAAAADKAAADAAAAGGATSGKKAASK